MGEKSEEKEAALAKSRIDNITIDKINAEANDSINKFNKAVDNRVSDTREYTTENGLKYSVSDKGIKIENDISKYKRAATLLMPKAYMVEKNSQGKTVYKCGPAATGNASVLGITVQEQLGQDLANYMISRDILKRQQEGGTVSPQEQVFISQTKQRIEEWGLVEKDGKLVQTNPKGMQITPMEVKDMSALEKQIEKDKKLAAKDNPTLKELAQRSR